MPVTLFSCSLQGLQGIKVEVEVDILQGMPTFTIVGLADTAIQEAKERIISAIKNSGFQFPRTKKTINLAPADIKKQGPSFDFPLACGLLLASKQIPLRNFLNESLFIGELALNGDLRRVNGVLLIADFAQKNGFKRIFLPAQNALEASLIPHIDIFPIRSLKEFVSFIRGQDTIPAYKRLLDYQQIIRKERLNRPSLDLDMAYVKGLRQAKRALEIAATGAHNVIMTGPPGSGKTLLARTFATILPELQLEEAIEVTKIYSLSGFVRPDQPLQFEPPFRSVHHTTSQVAIIGGGSFLRPGEITLAHKGVLFLDELPEFPLHVLEALRQPLEDHFISIGRASFRVHFPSHFMLLASMNPCPCGYLHDPYRTCSCTSSQIFQYQKRLSGPFLDRMDIFLSIPRTKAEELSEDTQEEPSEAIRERVRKARNIQMERFRSFGITLNSEMNLPLLRKHCFLERKAQIFLRHAMNTFHFSNRAYTRILKVARTIADLENIPSVQEKHLAEAIQYRQRTV